MLGIDDCQASSAVGESVATDHRLRTTNSL
jgi:hypothetical protein